MGIINHVAIKVFCPYCGAQFKDPQTHVKIDMSDFSTSLVHPSTCDLIGCYCDCGASMDIVPGPCALNARIWGPHENNRWGEGWPEPEPSTPEELERINQIFKDAYMESTADALNSPSIILQHAREKKP
jgi:hypothetical protein